MDRRDVGRRLRDHRTAAGISQQRLGALVGWGAGAISKIEKGHRGLHVEDAARLAGALGVTVDALVGRAANGCPPAEERVIMERDRDTNDGATVELARALAHMAELGAIQARAVEAAQGNIARMMEYLPAPHPPSRRDGEAAGGA